MKYFATRHEGAIVWAKKNGFNDCEFITHLNPADIKEGDIVYGILPIFMAAQICAKGARFFALNINIPAELRGKELTAEEMDQISCSVSEFYVEAR